MFKLNAAARCRGATTLFSVLLLGGLYAGPLQAGPAELPDELDVVGGNSSNSRMFWLNYDAESPFSNEAVQVNDDASSYPNLNSFTFFRNSCGSPRADVIAASTNASRLVLYRGGKGTGESICPAGNCPDRPSGLSTSNEQVVAVATTGAGGSTPAVTLFRPDGCDGERSLFTSHSSDAFSIAGETRLRFRSIVATDFVRADGGGLEAGDLLVLSSNPPMIARLTKDQIKKNVTDEASVLLNLDGFIRRATPTGMALVPGTGEIPNLLVTFSTGDVVNLAISVGNTDPKTAQRNLTDAAGMFPNPQGIAAGRRDEETYFVVSEQSQGRYIRAVIAKTQTPGDLAIVGDMRTIVSPVGAPQGVAILPELDEDPSEAQVCVDFDPGSDTPTTGCILENSIQVHLSQGYEGALEEGDVVTAKLISFPDTRGGAYVALNLPATDPDTEKFRNFSIPANCRGFQVEGEELPQLVLLDMGINFKITPGNFIQITELASRSLGLQDQTCDELGSRIYYHPQDPDNPDFGGVLFDTTFSCQNPSRSIVELFSPVVFCADSLYLARVERKTTNGPVAGIQTQRQLVNDEIRDRIAVLKDIIRELNADGRFSDLAATLQTAVTGISNPQSSVPQLSYVEASRAADDGALAVFRHKELFREEPVILAPDTYARLLSRFLSLAFYNWTTGALMGTQYGPPKAFCEFNLVADPPHYPELPDVVCSDYDPEP